MIRRLAVCFISALLLLFAATTQALAHASLQSCSVKNNQVFSQTQAPKTITATFAEPLDPQKSWINVFEGVADHGLVNETFRSRVNFRNPKQMTLRLPSLHREKYYMVWYTHSAADGHFAAGIVYFQVR